MSIEPDIPFVIGEWDILLSPDDMQFRAVGVYGVTNNHNGDDVDMGYGHTNYIDKEVMFQLDEVFVPWDLYDTANKNTMRWVQFYTVTSDDVVWADLLGQSVLIPLSNYPVPYAVWDMYASFAERVMWLDVLRKPVRAGGGDYMLYVDPTSGMATIEVPASWVLSMGAGASIKILYSTYGAGRMEWSIVGRESRAVDSAGASMVTAAFKNKGIEIGLAGLDMKDAEFGPRIPYIHEYFSGTGVDRADYLDNGSTPGDRAALLDDYCHTWPISSANIAVVGGPIANLAAEYFNDFTEARMISPELSPDLGLAGILAVTCWNRNVYPAVAVGGDVGYAVVNAYLDINGTAGFIIWGWTGDDTYFATKWLHEAGIYDLQQMNPCVTCLILKITYVDSYGVVVHPPSVSILEYLGPISEKYTQHDP
jgi:hypothetical protein